MFVYANEYLDDAYAYDSKYNFYKGIVECLSMQYENALVSFRMSMSLSDKYTKKVTRYECINLMLLGRFGKSYG